MNIDTFQIFNIVYQEKRKVEFTCAQSHTRNDKDYKKYSEAKWDGIKAIIKAIKRLNPSERVFLFKSHWLM